MHDDGWPLTTTLAIGQRRAVCTAARRAVGSLAFEGRLGGNHSTRKMHHVDYVAAHVWVCGACMASG